MNKPEKFPTSVMWNTDVQSIPKGKWVNETRIIRNGKLKGQELTEKVWRKDLIWIAVFARFSAGFQQKVTRTYWIPEQKRWCFFTQSEELKINAWAHYEELKTGQLAPVFGGVA